MIVLLQGLLINFAIITVFVLFVEQFLIHTELDAKLSWRRKVVVGLAHGILALILLNFSVLIDDHVQMNFRGVGLLLSAFLGGPLSLVISFVMMWTGRFIIEGSQELPQLVIGFVSLTGVCLIFAKVQSYWKKWLYGLSFFYIVYYSLLWLWYRTDSWDLILQYVLYQSACMIVIASFLKYLLHNRTYKQMVHQAEQELISTLRMQPGFTFKLHEHRGRYVYVLIEGQLLYQMGYEPNQFIGKSTDELSVIPKDLAASMHMYYSRAWQGERVMYESKILEHELLVTLQPIYQSGIVSEVIGTAVDITGHKNAEVKIREREEQYQILVENSDDFILSFNLDGTVTSVNQKLCQTLQLEANQLIGRLFSPMLTLDDADLWEQAFEQAVVEGTVQQFEMCMILADDQEHIYNVTLSPFYRTESEIGGVTGTIHDITDLKKRKEADEANWAKSQFLARMSHEIRTPLNGIIGLSLLMQKTELSETQKDYLHKIEASSNALLGTINDILDFSKIEAGKITLEKVDFSLEESLRKVADLSSPALGKKRIEMIIDTSEDLPMYVNGDPFRLEQVLINLANNAIKFTENGNISIKVGLEAYVEDNVLLSFSIEDTGIGIAKDQLVKLFSPFTQADSSTSRKYGGTGLGLVICQHLIQSMGGILKVESKQGVGSRFYFTVMFEQSRQEFAEHPVLTQLADGSHHSLVAEDHPMVREQLCRMLSSFQLQVKAAANVSELCQALEDSMEARTPVYDYIIVDMEMEQLRKLQAWTGFISLIDRKTTKVIALTTIFGREELDKYPFDLRPDAVMMKPVCKLNFLQTLQSLAQVESADAQALVAADKEMISEEAAFRGHILVAEDNEINQLVITHMLERLGYQVTIAGNGHEVLAQADEQPWSLVLMDLHMPEMDGYETTRKLRQSKYFNRIPIVALTANVLSEDHERCLKIGMNDILIKPVDEERLLQMIQKWQNLTWLNRIEGMDTMQVMKNLDEKIHIFQYMVNKFKQDYRNFYQQLETALYKQEMTLARRMVHTLKGVSANFFAASLFDAVQVLDAELAEGAGVTMEQWKLGAARIQMEINRIIQSLDAA
ncbi:response regulator [Paenibacillus aestuarii]|uniref:histidine kinase n=1 Tax=Paenibacillus aestuarii TaxID=516965 RepID=A0ABW0K9Y7_9BACL|nr:response regulator [Paenibacillus aestuarii]